MLFGSEVLSSLRCGRTFRLGTASAVAILVAAVAAATSARLLRPTLSVGVGTLAFLLRVVVRRL